MDITLSILGDDSKPISKLSANQGISHDDLFLVARTGQSAATMSDEDIDKILFEEYGIDKTCPFLTEARSAFRIVRDEGWKLRYSDLSARLLNDISAQFGFKNMAYCDDWQYSLKNHIHPYSTVDFFPVYTYAKVSAQYKDKSQCTGPYSIPEYLGTVEMYKNIGGNYCPLSVDMYMPHLEFLQYQEPDIGEIRFLARNPFTRDTQPMLTSVYSDNDMLYDSENNGYWVYPRGQTITCGKNEFKAACLVYGDTRSESDIRFTIPLISGFVRPLPASADEKALSNVNWQNGLIEHSDHIIDNNSIRGGASTVFANATLKTSIYESSYRVHSGNGVPDLTHKVNLISAEIDVQNIKNQNTQTDYSDTALNIETYPDHQNPVTIIYIGKKL